MPATIQRCLLHSVLLPAGLRLTSRSSNPEPTLSRLSNASVFSFLPDWMSFSRKSSFCTVWAGMVRDLPLRVTQLEPDDAKELLLKQKERKWVALNWWPGDVNCRGRLAQEKLNASPPPGTK